MGREKRKARLNKGESGEFLGFAAFAAPAAAPSATNGAPSSAPSLTLAPIYTGSDSSLSLLFPRIGQKRDATTKTKALGDLKVFFADSSKPKKAQVEALSHLCYLFHSKLHYDNTPRVRAGCLECFLPASESVPKAWKTLTQVQPEILGMILCSTADPGAEVRMAANALVESLSSSNPTIFTEGMWDYVERILSYGNSKTMNAELFQKKDSASALSDEQKEELEERYERIVGAAIGGMQLYLQKYHSETTTETTPRTNVKFLWKAMASTKPSLRQRTFSLLATSFQKAPSLIDNDKISKLLLQSLSSEKEASNIPSLLETLISFVASYPKEDRSSTMALYTKPLTKLFKKGCHGATRWSPTVLPIVALLPQEEQASLLTCVWEGRVNVTGVADELEVVGAVAETATFLLLKAKHDFSEIIAKCWLHSLQTFLTTEGSGSAKRSLDKLCEILARDLMQLNQASHSKDSSAIFQLKDWFWNQELEKVVLQDNVDNGQLLSLIRMLQVKEATEANHQWAHIIQKKFHKLLATCQGNSGLVPAMDVYELWIAILEKLSVDQVFEKATLDKFVMNDLLRWMVIHTSSVSEQSNAIFTRCDFTLYRLCRSMTNDGVWNTLLKELVAAKCDLSHLRVGLETVLKAEGSADLFPCPTLDELCVQVAQEAVQPSELTVDDSVASDLSVEHNQKVLNFLQMCVGLGEYDNLVETTSIESITKYACPEDYLISMEDNPVLETLVQMMIAGRLDAQDEKNILVQSWRQGGDLWESKATPFAAEKESHLVSLIDMASTEIKAMMKQVSSEHLSHIWSERANRLLGLCRIENETTLPEPDLSLVGLSDQSQWTSEPSPFLSMCLMNLLSHIDSTENKRSLFSNFQSPVLELFLNILLSLSSANSDALKADLARRRTDTCSVLLQAIDAASIEKSQLDKWCNKLVSLLAASFEKGDEMRCCRGIALLSQLIEFRFRTIRPVESSADDQLQIHQIVKGDTAWYITKSEDPSVREKCTIVKVHNDLPGERYFTIRVNRDGEDQERQTVVDRLRRAPFVAGEASAAAVYAKDISMEESLERGKLLKPILDQLIVPNCEKWPAECFELVSIAISQYGLLGGRGIGTDHHMILQNLMKIQSDHLGASEELSSESVDKAAVAMQSLSYALGYGKNVPTFHSLNLVGFSPVSSMKSIVGYLDENETEVEEKFDSAAAMWLSVSAPEVTDKDLRQQVFWHLYRLSARLIQREGNDGFSSCDFVALRAIAIAQKENHKSRAGVSLLDDSEAEALSALVKSFFCQWDSECQDGLPLWSSSKVFDKVFSDGLSNRSSLMGRACRPCIDDVVDSLSSKTKRAYAAKLLKAYADEGVPLHAESTAPNSATASKLDQWCAGLINEEIEELEDDVDAVTQWVPAKMMNELESWYESTGAGNAAVPAVGDSAIVSNASSMYVVDEAVACARMLAWNSLCEITKVAAEKDSVNRSSFAAYITKCKAVDSILNLALSYGNVGTDRKMKFEKVVGASNMLEPGTEIDLARLSALTIFNTIEVFPSISKTWWEMGCPKTATQAIREFVETNVSPEILRNELQHMKQTSSFGDMNVKGSAMSREVTASYVQDDFTLSVAIATPISFPFRSAVVDCSKTYGVPEKRWKRWALQITQILNTQGGTLSDALMLWKDNVDKEFEGVEPCPVCYSVLHVKTHKQPTVACNTCHNRFHIECLSQWFRQSGKRNCVICQQPWSGTRVS
mmetsp:Transcript_30460/g.73043  ORF Transcript_30460/g.73043 Transcript_30460/m.73043 type:complete len:1725 (-) Transcript_30460:73-5247(-)|eukprot:CAMPEP_0113618534 /NCGR_PEP_ID=MMETSP0017_2-20120614/9386_1 /TAXON_ID=2856 /ORGANISM="Cylindrotheca closterium" /LENGTH=1724 /DNA_ID=CAMNT_0000528045 /DNA_START=115 /DNA_END=5289 /DNA_ORIENTATION=- /assembly_acc=CAM_ASM_000147